jgi:hypothetical protein
MIVFHQRGVIQADAMVGAAAHAHGVLLQRAQPGGGFARVENVAGEVFAAASLR